MGFFLLDWNGEQHGGPGRKQHGEQNGARALGKGADAGQNAAGIAAAWMGAGLFPVSVICCALVLLIELFV